MAKYGEVISITGPFGKDGANIDVSVSEYRRIAGAFLKTEAEIEARVDEEIEPYRQKWLNAGFSEEIVEQRIQELLNPVEEPEPPVEEPEGGGS